MKNPFVQLIRSLVPAALLAVSFCASAQVNEYWDPGGLMASPGSGGTGTWSTATNWWVSGSADSVWTNDNIAVFDGTGGTVTVGAAETANGITFGTSNYTIGGSSTLTLAGTPVITLFTGTNTISAPLAGTVPVTVAGSGILALTHANTSLTGGMTINSGSTVAITSVTGAGANTATVTNNGTLDLLTTGAANYAFPLAGNGTVNMSMAYNTASENLRIDGPQWANFSGTVNIIAGLSASNTPGAAQLILTNAQGSGITWNVGSGATLLVNPIPVPSPFPANLIILNGPGNSQPYGALRLDATTLQANVLLNGSGITIGDDSATAPSAITGVISDGGNHYGFISVVVSGKILVLEGANTYTGPTVIGGNGETGTLQLAAPETPGTSGPLGTSATINPGNIVFAGGTLEYSATNSTDYSGRFSTNAGQACIINLNGQSVTFANPLVSSSGTLTLSDSAGGGTLTLAATNTYNGVTTVNSGTLNLTGNMAGTVLTVNGSGVLQLNSSTGLPSGTILTLPASPNAGQVNLNFNGVQNITTLNFGVSPMPSGTYGSTSNLSVQYQNAAFVGNGVLNVQPPTYWDPAFSGTAPGSGGNGSWDSTSTNWLIGTNDTRWASNNVANFSGTAGTVTLNANETTDGLTFDTDGYTISGSSVLTLGGTPIITVNSGSAEIDCTLAGTAGLTETGGNMLTLGGANTFAGALTIGDGCSLVLNNPNAFAGPTTMGAGSMLTIGNSGNIGGGAYPGAINNGGEIFFSSSANQTLSGLISGAGILIQNGPGTLTLSGYNTFSGSITINSNTLVIGNPGDLGNNPTFNVGGYSASITDDGTFVYSSSAAQTLSGPINGTGNLVVNGSGVLTLTSQDAYTGTTTIGTGSQLVLSGAADLGNGDYGTNITNNGTFTDSSSFSQTVEGAISGSGTVTQNGTALLTLNGTNTYTGTTTISSGTIALGANASINDSASISIAAGATFDVSALSSYSLSTSNSLTATGNASAAATINGPASGTVNFGAQPISLTFAPQTFTGDTTHPALTIAQGALALGGNYVTVRNSGGTPLGIGTYTLIQVNGGTITGSATLNGSVLGAGLAAGTAGSLSATNGALNLVVATAPTQPTISHFAVSGGNLILSGTNGPPNGNYVVLMTTNVALPLSSWTPVSTNTFSGTGTFSVTNAITGTKGFFAIEVP